MNYIYAQKAIYRLNNKLIQSKCIEKQGETDIKRYDRKLLKLVSITKDILTPKSNRKFFKQYKKDLKTQIGTSEVEYEYSVEANSVGEDEYLQCLTEITELALSYTYYILKDEITNEMIIDEMKQILKDEMEAFERLKPLYDEKKDFLKELEKIR